MGGPPANLLSPGHNAKDKSSSSLPSSSWKAYMKELGMDTLSLCLTLPILTFFTLIALLNTAKRHFDLKHSTSSNNINQRRLQEMKVDEKITRDETYYAKRWGYDCQEHTAITEDGFILKMYRFSSNHAGRANGMPSGFQLPLYLTLRFLFFCPLSSLFHTQIIENLFYSATVYSNALEILY
jgi:hypothetical protein